MTLLRKILITALLLITILHGFPQATPPKFTAAQLIKDYEILTGALKDAHPGLYRYTTKEKFDRLFAETRSKIDHSMTEEEFYKLVMPLIANIKCGHTKFHRQGKPDDRYPFHNDNLFPLKLYFVHEKAYMLYSYEPSVHVAPASEVVTINGKPVSDIIKQLRSYITVDGDVQSAVYEELNHSFNGYYATFVENVKNYKITYKDNRRQASSTLPGVKLQAIEEREHENIPESRLPLRLACVADSIAVLTIESFYVDSAVQQFYPFIDSAFRDIKDKKIRNLIIDVRNNEGGEEDWGGYLYSYLADKSFTYYKKLVLTKRGNYKFTKYAVMPPELDYMKDYIQEKDGEVVFTGQQYLYEKQPQENRYTGKVYMLINGVSFSVTTELASMVHNNKRATFVGEETGGAYYGNNSGVFEILTLPHTKLTAGIPLVAFYSNVSGYPYKSRGILPDYTVSSPVHDILDKRDVIMEGTLRLIEAKKERVQLITKK